MPTTADARAHTHPLGMARAAPAPASSPVGSGYIGLRPQDLHTVYALPTTTATPQTIALVDAYNDPTAEADLKTYDEEFGLPECTTANGCFSQVNQNGENLAAAVPENIGRTGSRAPRQREQTQRSRTRDRLGR